jgi:hypothetical protein
MPTSWVLGVTTIPASKGCGEVVYIHYLPMLALAIELEGSEPKKSKAVEKEAGTIFDRMFKKIDEPDTCECAVCRLRRDEIGPDDEELVEHRKRIAVVTPAMLPIFDDLLESYRRERSDG